MNEQTNPSPTDQTPRTDAAVWHDTDNQECVMAHVARNLECELSVMTADSERLKFLSDLFRECPHAEIHFNDDADQEPWPVGYTIHVDGCDPITVTKPTLEEAIDAFIAASKEDRS